MAYNPLDPQPPDRGEFVAGGNPPTVEGPAQPGQTELLFAAARENGIPPEARRVAVEDDELGQKMLRLVREAEASAENYTTFVRRSWDRAYRAHRNQHFSGSKYDSKDYHARSKLFRPKTRSATRKAMAAHAASLFSTKDAMTIEAGNEADPNSRAAAALMQEVVNYRLARTSGRNAIKWFLTCIGAVQDATLTGIVASKQSWLLETRTVGEREVTEVDPVTGQEYAVMEMGEDGQLRPVTEPVLKVVVDRPESVLIPPDQIIIDSGADWRDPAQTAAFLCVKWPMKIDQIRQKQKDPRDPWKPLPDSVLRSGQAEGTRAKSQSIRQAREGGTDRYDQINTGATFGTIWVSEWFVRADGEDYTFYCIGSQHLLTDPVPVEEKYPWNFGERPISFGYGSLESHKIFPMSAAESWQQLQQEINDVANLTLDSLKMNIAPLAKVRRGRQVDLEKMRVRGPGTTILMTDPAADVVFEKPPGPDAAAWAQMERLNNDFDSLAGQFDQSSVVGNRQLNETVGGMRLLSGAANALGEFDQRVVIETWLEPSLAQIVRLCQFYEHDATILGLAGDRAQLWQRFGVDEITDRLLEAEITTSIDLGLGTGDPMQRLSKFTMAANAAAPLLKDHPKFKTGEYELDAKAIVNECFAAAGYRDGGDRFIKINPPQQQGPDPAQAAEVKKIEAEAQDRMAAAELKHAQALTEIEKLKIEIEKLKLERIETMHGIEQDRAEFSERNLDRALTERRHRDDRAFQREDRDQDRMDRAADRALKRDDIRGRHDIARARNAQPRNGAQQPAPLAPAPRQPSAQSPDIRAIVGRIASAMPTQPGLPPPRPPIELPPSWMLALANQRQQPAR